MNRHRHAPYPCGRVMPKPLSRRQMLAQCAGGFGTVALAALMAQDGMAVETSDADNGKANARLAPLTPKPGHYEAKARSVIFLYMDGGPSQIDTFDYKPMLAKHNGQSSRDVIGKIDATQFDDIGKVMQSPWNFQQYGECGAWVSDLFPHLAKQVDDLAIIKSMVSNFPEHTNANYFLHTGHGIQGRPSMGSWITYGLGSENQDLPGYVVLNGGLIPPGGPDNFNNGFLPATYQGSIFNAGSNPVANINRQEPRAELQSNKLALLKKLDGEISRRTGEVDPIESAIANYELAARMQLAVPDLMDLNQETQVTKDLYGLSADSQFTQIFGAQCLLARRLVERGVRFIELTCHNDRWDHHENILHGHAANSLATDRPIAALIQDLKVRGLFEQTLLVWGGEFGRTPFAQAGTGRDHNPAGFTMWMAGGGIRGGIQYGATDEWGYRAIENRCEVHDLHATILHLLGIDHTKLTYRFSGRDMRLTDVFGHVVKDILK